MWFLFIALTIIVVVPYALIRGAITSALRPVEDIETTTTSNEPQEVIIKNSKLNLDNIPSWEGEEHKKFEFRPRTFNEFIGQENAKERARTVLRKIRRKMKGHFIIDGIKGHGKTSFVNLIANNLNARVIERIGKQIDEENLEGIIREINESVEEHVILFIDEIDTMNWKMVKLLNPIIESFKINGLRIKPFIFASATINKHILIKNNPDTLDRIATHIKFTRYNSTEIGQILAQYKNQMYATENISSNVIEQISKNCKFNPRTSIGLLEEYVVEKNMNRVLKNCGVIKNGLTERDIQILSILKKSSKALGANCLALKSGMSQNEYLREYEPFLLEYDYVNRTPSRIITDKGKKLLEELHEIK